MAKLVSVELIDRNLLISKLMAMEVYATGGFGRRNQYFSREVERFVKEEIVQTVRELPYYTV